APSHHVEPPIRRDPDQVAASVPDRLVDRAHRPEAAQERVLQQVFGVPEIFGQPPAIAVQLGSKRRDCVQIARPRTARAVAQSVGKLVLVHGRRSPLVYLERRAGWRSGYVATMLTTSPLAGG